ncbi:hypothetical protein RI129_000796 [Pyrocoelia pectoralis]|uniref:Uncharacterized protein n=1 Tax=Pyrocoelia pectoralis TaxID=417401 RepID=A0AAN7VJN9_9COLE
MSLNENKTKACRNKIKLETLSKICDRYGLSDRSAAAIATAVLQDVGVVSSEDTTNVIDRSKVRRARSKNRENIQQQHGFCLNNIAALYFDGKKDKTLCQEKVDNKYYRKSVVEEHISLIQEPGSHYIGHVAPNSSSAKNIAEEILNFFEKRNFHLQDLMVVGCDGTVTNTGFKNGIITQLEVKLKRPLQRFICQLHGNELLLRHLFNHIDGNTTGPKGYSGLIGKQLEKCHILEIVQFQPIPCKLPVVDVTELSTDQKYLYEICCSIEDSNFSSDVFKRDPGKMSHSRWLTTANRILRLYTGSRSPTPNLQILANFIMQVYAPMWFSIKFNSSCKNGATHVWKTVQLTRYLDESLKKVIDPVISRNSYFIHPENLLLSMLADSRTHIRELALRRILKAKLREADVDSDVIRPFRVPVINFSAIDYVDLIDWQTCEITSPPVLQNFSVEDIEQLVFSDSEKMVELTSFPCHTQAVERCVKLVSEASLSVIGSGARDGFILANIQCRQKMPHFETKREFNQ